ncbi:aldose 1-epimerase family protein [Methylobrevis pamukkalensis]|uniref:Aldose 1-epimerase n=1 Tax=Methylobrevis pamukkalensis TaxID=1439726 RepID=A0A1E3GZH9_9HYPH|nr:aldose 1-epimerase family protein [Methylobrevis pamukkalensis]ODN68976.1 Aldose 1-epimerase [Methylobrevis pamukkalensis]
MAGDLVTIGSDLLTATISPDGAELQSLRDGEGRDLLWDGDPAVWAGRAPILFPIVGMVAGDRYRVGAEVYTLPRHGFARRRRFAIVDTSESRAVFRLEADAQMRAVYPFDFRLDMAFDIAGASLSLTATVTNTGSGTLPASFGFHPAFRWPLPYGAARAEHILRFSDPETAPIRRLDARGLIDPAPVPTPVQGRDLPLADALFEADAVVFDGLASHRLAYGVPGSPGLVVDFAGMPHLGIWSMPGAGYVCIEPWQGHSDPAGFDGEIFDKPGIVTIAPGASRDFAMAVRLSPDPFGEI